MYGQASAVTSAARHIIPRAALVVLFVLLTDACGQAAGSGGGSAPTSTSQGAVTPAQADALYLEIAGTVDQRAAGDELAYHIEEDPVTACMVGAGINYTPIPFVNQWQDWPSAGSSTFDTSWLAPLSDPEYLTQFVQSQAAAQRTAGADRAASDQAYYALSPDAKKAWDAAMSNCPEGTGYVDAWHPAGYSELIGLFHNTVNGIDHNIGETYADSYASCMSNAGYTNVSDRLDLLAALQSQQPPNGEIPDVGSSGGPDWQAWVASVDQAFSADAACRADAYNAGWASLGPALSQFESENAAALAAEEAGWEKIVSGGAAPS
jgi:hypothetical protein